MTSQNSSEALLSYLVNQANSGQANWFSFPQQRIVGIHLAYEIAKLHADKMTPDEIVSFVVQLNNTIYTRILKG